MSELLFKVKRSQLINKIVGISNKKELTAFQINETIEIYKEFSVNHILRDNLFNYLLGLINGFELNLKS